MITNSADTQLQGKTLEPCPWCPVKTELSLYHLPDSPSRHVYCRQCNGAGPWGDSDDEAITVWNSRAAVAGPSLTSVKEAIKSVKWSSDKSDPETMSTPNKDLGRYMKDVLVAVDNAFAATSSSAESRIADMAEPKSEAERICVYCQRQVESREFGPPINDVVWSHVHNGVVWCHSPTTPEKAREIYAAPAESTRVEGGHE